MSGTGNKVRVEHNIEGFLVRLNGESPRSRILLESGLLEELLRSAILRRLATNKSSKELFGEGSALGLVTLAKYAHALGLIGSREIDALKKFAKARNKIAHSWQCDFTDPELQKISASIQFLVMKGEDKMPDHQRCFARLDYLGVYLTEEFFNRFLKSPSTIYDGGVFAKSLFVDPVTGAREMKVESAP